MGAEGPQGDPGTGGFVKDVYETYAEMIENHPSGEDGEFYIVGNSTDEYRLYVWNSEADPEPTREDAGTF